MLLDESNMNTIKENINNYRRVCCVCKFLDANILSTYQNSGTFYRKSRSYGCEHEPLTVTERILLSSPSSKIKPKSEMREFSEQPIGTQDSNSEQYSDIYLLKNMLIQQSRRQNDLSAVAKDLSINQEASKVLQKNLQFLSENAIESVDRISLSICKNISMADLNLNIYQKEIKWFLKLIVPHFSEISNDAFGNYVIQKLLEEKYLHEYIEENIIKSNVSELSKQMYGCRVVQKAIEQFERADFIYYEILSNFVELACIQSSNHVLQKIIDKCIQTADYDIIVTIIEYSIRDLTALSNNKYGCRILQKLLEIEIPALNDNENTTDIIEGCLKNLHRCILSNIEELATDQFGNYVIQHILSLDIPIRDIVVRSMLLNIRKFSQQKFASNIIEKIIIINDPAYSKIVYEKLFESNEGKPCLYFLAKDKYGNYVVQQFYKALSEEDKAKFQNVLKKYFQELKGNVYSKHLTHTMLYGE